MGKILVSNFSGILTMNCRTIGGINSITQNMLFIKISTQNWACIQQLCSGYNNYTNLATLLPKMYMCVQKTVKFIFQDLYHSGGCLSLTRYLQGALSFYIAWSGKRYPNNFKNSA